MTTKNRDDMGRTEMSIRKLANLHGFHFLTDADEVKMQNFLRHFVEEVLATKFEQEAKEHDYDDGEMVTWHRAARKARQAVIANWYKSSNGCTC